jgi:hypothetical protein
LSIRREGPDSALPPATGAALTVNRNGPLVLRSGCTVTHADGRVEVREQTTAFCRCGASANKPYCDGSHKSIDFQG